MSRTDLDATTLASGLRMRAGDGSMEWVYEPIQASVLLDIADMLDENAKLTKLARWMYRVMDESCATRYPYQPAPVSMQALMRAEKELQALGIEVGK